MLSRVLTVVFFVAAAHATTAPSQTPSKGPTQNPTKVPTDVPTLAPTTAPGTSQPSSAAPSTTPATAGPTTTPATTRPSASPATARPTKGPTDMPTPPQALQAPCDTATTAVASGISYYLTQSYNNTNEALLIVSGPSTAWFGLGYGTAMIGSKAVIVKSSTDAKLYTLTAKDVAGITAETNQPTISQAVVVNGTRTVCLRMVAANLPVGFPGAGGDLIYARGSSLTFAQHGGTAVDRGTVLAPTASDGIRFSFGVSAILAVVAAVLVW